MALVVAHAAGQPVGRDPRLESERLGPREEREARDPLLGVAHPRVEPGTDRLVDGHRRRQHFLAAHAVAAGRNEEGQAIDEVRGNAHQDAALDERLAHLPDLALLQVADPAVDELRGGGRGGAAEVAAFDERDRETAQRRVPRGEGAGDPPADDDQIEAAAGETAEVTGHGHACHATPWPDHREI